MKAIIFHPENYPDPSVLESGGAQLVSLRPVPDRKEILNGQNKVRYYENYELPEFQRMIIDSGFQKLFIKDGKNLWYLFEYGLFNAGFVTGPLTTVSIERVLFLSDLVQILKKRKVMIEVRGEHPEVCALRTLLGGTSTSHPLRQHTFWRTMLSVRIKARNLLARKLRKGVDILIISPDFYKRRTRKENYFWGGLLEELDTNRANVSMLEYERLWKKNSWKSFLSRGEDKYIGDYYSREYRKAYRKYLKIIAQIRKDVMQELGELKFKGETIGPLLRERFRFVLYTMAPYYADILASTEEVLRVEEPKAVLVDQEEGSYAKGFMYAAKDLPTKIIAFQYELVYRSCLHAHTVDESLKDKTKETWRPVPDLKFVSGDYCKKILLDHCNYEPGMLHVVGQPRYDPYFREAKKITAAERKRARREMGIPDGMLVVLYTSSQYKVEKQPFNAFLAAAKGRDWFLLVRPHPYEPEPDLFLNDIKKNGFEYRKVDNRSDIRLQFKAADLLVSVGSTTIMEGMIYGLPCVLLEGFRGTSVIPYAEYGAALTANNVQTLKTVFDNIEREKRALKKMQQGRKKFLEAYLHKPDGKAAKRAAKEIRKLIHSSS